MASENKKTKFISSKRTVARINMEIRKMMK